MITKSDDRELLAELIKKLDASDMKQIMAFAAGYEAIKRKRDSTSISRWREESPKTNLTAVAGRHPPLT